MQPDHAMFFYCKDDQIPWMHDERLSDSSMARVNVNPVLVVTNQMLSPHLVNHAIQLLHDAVRCVVDGVVLCTRCHVRRGLQIEVQRGSSGVARPRVEAAVKSIERKSEVVAWDAVGLHHGTTGCLS